MPGYYFNIYDNVVCVLPFSWFFIPSFYFILRMKGPADWACFLSISPRRTLMAQQTQKKGKAEEECSNRRDDTINLRSLLREFPFNRIEITPPPYYSRPIDMCGSSLYFCRVLQGPMTRETRSRFPNAFPTASKKKKKIQPSSVVLGISFFCVYIYINIARPFIIG